MSRGEKLRRNRLLRAGSHHATLWLGKRLPGAVPLVYVMGYPKSGTTWMSQLVADYLQLPLIRASILPVGMPAVIHGHQTVRPEFSPCLYGVRDGRDAFVSLYFFLAKRLPEGDRPAMNKRQRGNFPGLINRDNVVDNFTPFVLRQLENPFATRAAWGAHAMGYIASKQKRLAIVKYEDLLADGVATFAKALESMYGEAPDLDKVRMSIDKYSFAKQAGRRMGQEDRASFLRKGGSGDWKNHFTREAAEAFEKVCGESLRALGYESDASWVERCPTLEEKRAQARG
ncbi:MAG: sulfotransferase domain-containing protein [Phycisphaerales bacterium]